jgi:sulfide dehydrogenase [flavocytochrome c] flavoprotein subunit
VQEDVKANVINALPSMRAGLIAVQTGLANQANNRWCGVNYQTFESTAAKDVHVLGDSIQIAPAMPKSGHMANSHARWRLRPSWRNCRAGL